MTETTSEHADLFTLNDEISDDIEDQEAPTDAISALSSLQPILEQISPEDTKTGRVSGAKVTAYCAKLQQKAQGYATELDSTFVHSPRNFIEQLLPCARAYWAAQSALESIDPSAVDRKKLYKQAGTLKQRVVRALEFYAEDDPQIRFVLEVIRPGTGYVDRAEDLQKLYAALQPYRDQLLQRQLLSIEDIERIPKLAEQLLEPSTSETKIKDARLLRDRAWTLLVEAYNEVMHHLRFVLRHTPTEFAQLGSLFFPPSTSRATKKPTPQNPPPAPQG